jgi:hypothetical protein
MVNMGQMSIRPPRDEVHAVGYEPPSHYGSTSELYRGDELHRRAQPIRGRVERVDFHVLLYLCEGGYAHTLDFDEVRCHAGSLVILRPGRFTASATRGASSGGWSSSAPRSSRRGPRRSV